jgi:hypothetical protein
VWSWHSIGVGGVISQKKILFKTTAVKTSNPTLSNAICFYLFFYNFSEMLHYIVIKQADTPVCDIGVPLLYKALCFRSIPQQFLNVHVILCSTFEFLFEFQLVRTLNLSKFEGLLYFPIHSTPVTASLSKPYWGMSNIVGVFHVTNRRTPGLSNAAPAGAMEPVIYFPGALIYSAGFNVNQNSRKKIFLNNSMFQFFS